MALINEVIIIRYQKLKRWEEGVIHLEKLKMKQQQQKQVSKRVSKQVSDSEASGISKKASGCDQNRLIVKHLQHGRLIRIRK